MIKKLLAKCVYKPVYDIYKGDIRRKALKMYRRDQWNSIHKNKLIQAENLYAMIKYATEEIPYYKNLLNKHKITFSKETIFEDVTRFPILTKEIIKKEFNNLFVKRDNAAWYYNQSGGSTGKAIKLLQDKEYQSKGSAMTAVQLEWMGFDYGDSFLKLWGSEKDLYNETESIKNRFSNWINSMTLLNSFLMNSDDMRKHLKVINHVKPKFILAYAQSIYELAKFAEAEKIQVSNPKAIMTSATMLHPYEREKIEKVFKCKVFDRYGSREVGNIASECDKHEGYHISMFTHYVEILDDKMRPCKEGETGEIYITLLSNFTMPLIRYKIGDRAKITKKPCSCGRGLTLIKSIEGRVSDFFLKRDGSRVDAYFFDFPIWDKDWLISYQIIQKGYDLILYRLKVKSRPTKEELKEITDKVQIVMGRNCKIIFKFVNVIKPTKSGKYLYILRDF